MIEITDKILASMRETFDPSRYYGFLSGMAFAHLCRDLDQDSSVPRDGELRRFATLRDQFVEDQIAAGEPDGRPLPAMFWTDLYPVPVDSLEEVISCTEHGCVVMLCSSVEPHVRWFVTLGGGDDDDVTEFFDAKAIADRFLADRLKEGQAQRAQAISDAHEAVRAGDTIRAASISHEAGLSWSHRAGDNFIMIEGTKVDIGDRPQPQSDPRLPVNGRWVPRDGT